MAVTLGPVGVLREPLANVPGIERAMIYGSWAARYHGQTPPGARGHRRPRRWLTKKAWDAASSSLKKALTSRPIVDLAMTMPEPGRWPQGEDARSILDTMGKLLSRVGPFR